MNNSEKAADAKLTDALLDVLELEQMLEALSDLAAKGFVPKEIDGEMRVVDTGDLSPKFEFVVGPAMVCVDSQGMRIMRPLSVSKGEVVPPELYAALREDFREIRVYADAVLLKAAGHPWTVLCEDAGDRLEVLRQVSNFLLGLRWAEEE